MKTLRPAALAAVGIGLPALAFAADTDELAAIRQQMETLQQSYQTRMADLEQRLAAAEAVLEERQAAPPPVVPAVSAAPVAAPVPTTAGALADNRFNPAISLVLQGSLNSYSSNPDDYRLPGFQTGGEAGLAAEGLTLDETELTASASVDHQFYAQTTIGLHDDEGDTEVEVEEAYVDPMMLPAGAGGRFGRFFSNVGYLNRFHTHAWDFHDEPLVYRAFLGKQYGDDGIRIDWTAPSDLYVNLGAETFAGNNFPAGESESVFGDVKTLFVKLGGDVGTSHAWQAGVSTLLADAHDRASGHSHGGGEEGGSAFSGDSDLYIADFIWKWAPDGNPARRNFKLQGEGFYREEDGDVLFSEDGDVARLDYDGNQAGFYAQAVYQFMPHWRAGVRYDWLQADNDQRITDLGGFADADEVLEESGFDDEGYEPERIGFMVDWSPSEFSRLRAQYNLDDSRPDDTDHQWSLQYIMSLGSHGAHEF